MVPSIKQILTHGILALLLVMAMAFSIAAIPNAMNYQWIVFFFMAATPTQIIIGILWQNNLPFIKGLDQKPQPYKGIILTLISALSGLVIGSLTILTLAKGNWILSPQLSHYMIIVIITTIWLAVVVNFWPFIGRVKNIVGVGILTLILAYTLAYLIWVLFFNYESVAGLAPWYLDILDPKGAFNFVNAIVFIISCCPIILYLALFDSWILDRWTGGKQPVKTIINTLLVLVITFAFQSFFVEVIKMDIMVYMVLVPICMVFGVFLVNNMTQFLLFEKTSQPLKGLYKIIVATSMGLLMYAIYYNLSPYITGEDLAAGKTGSYRLDLWIADIMLGISFPLILVLTGFFSFWPIKKRLKK
ncbi:hypothetical protein Q4Q34_10720 [Flavivirga abyssicola]|uniref:hypothetical protein n=1 Tax=Flavivirga abyssicola TaxID=3063533 RepID=UPI0026E06314|nr:hypothetical protein [Flavivirga sp. MEBiC07777]WVK11698.1 hypothetical protein Q4Q34_10720 [Flavivirga sp. MEBiC07777]